MVAIRGEYRMGRGWHYTKLSLSSVLLFFFLACALCYCSFLFLVFVLFLFCFCFRALVGALVDVPPIFSCPADHVPDCQPRILLGMVEARSINRSGLNHTQYYTWLPIRYVVSWTERDQRNIYQAPMRAKENTNKNDKEKGTRIAKYIPIMPEKDRRRAFDRESLA